MTYLKESGYAPGVGIIGKNIVYIENRNGNSGVQTFQDQTLCRMFELLESQEINIDVFRADSGSYQLSTVAYIADKVDAFFIKSRMSQQLHKAIEQVSDWEKIEINNEEIYRGSTSFIPFKTIARKNKITDQLNEYRLVITKIKRKDNQLNLFTQEPFIYSAILTNDYKKTNDEVVFFYNQRGTIEQEFDIMKNDFGWKNLPFSHLDQNTVFLIITAMCRNIYNYIINLFSKKYKGLRPQFRIKKFIFRFICTPAKWIKKSRAWKLRLYGNIAFKT
jgi:hypothetical protein